MTASAAEILAALSLVPVLASVGIDSNGQDVGFTNHISREMWLLLFLLAATVRSLLNWRASVMQQRGTQDLAVTLQSRLYRALARSHWDTIRRISPPRITSALQTQTYDAVYGFNGMIQAFTGGVLVLGYLLATGFVLPIVLPILLILLTFMWLLNRKQGRNVQIHSESYVDATTELHEQYADWVSVSRIASLGVDPKKLENRYDKAVREAASHAVSYARSSAATQLTYQLALIGAVLIGVPVAWWLETHPALLAFGLLAFVRVLPRAGAIHGGYQEMISATAPLKSIDQLATELESDPISPPDHLRPLEWQRLRLSEVSVVAQLRDASTRWILRDVDIELEHGEWLAVTGPTGAGKTTLADTLLMLLRPDSGEIRIDEIKVNEELASRWRNQAAYVPQDVILFDASLRENLKLYVPDATDDQILTALKQAAGEFVMERLPDRLETQVGPGGRHLSGGERQRIGIARALLKKPGFLVLDEPTAALDQDTQAKLMNALANLDHKMSVVFITHRPELLKLADKIIGIEDGRITRRDGGFRRSDRGSDRQ